MELQNSSLFLPLFLLFQFQASLTHCPQLSQQITVIDSSLELEHLWEVGRQQRRKLSSIQFTKLLGMVDAYFEHW
ncbi:hypothetical protein Goarm_020925 [Gossypium armourianum]|uniref:Uncharacterized protein n=1 Tax=Gossypium armourianum TaxID=34283 RepID=A0A7J9ISU7_9ROSI|nr:hypothetical protein [Gossypium armourianum]